jgi:twitching motility protein PilJ
MFGNPVLLGAIGLLVLLIAGFSANFYMMGSVTSGSLSSHAGNLKVSAQAISKHASMVADGNASAARQLSEERVEFESSLSVLRHGNAMVSAAPELAQSTLSRISDMWDDMKSHVDAIEESKDSVTAIRETGADININLQLLQQENNKFVRGLGRSETAASEIILAQRQSTLLERMGHTIDKMIDRGSDPALTDQYQRDSDGFKTVLLGFRKGDKGLSLTAITESSQLAFLSRMTELFGSVDASAKDVIAAGDDVTRIRNAALAIYSQSADFVPAVDSLNPMLADAGGSLLGSKQLGTGLGVAVIIVFLVITLLIHRISNTNVSETAQQNEENQAAILQLLDELADLADGDLRVQATVTESFTGAIADSINFSIDQMRGLVSQINETAVNVSSAAEQTRNSVKALSEASQRQAQEISDVSEAVNEMAVSIDLVSSNAAESSSVAERSVDIANKGAVVVQNTIDGMDKIRGQIQETAKRIKRLGESSQEIGDIVALINDIADQTNILSLNAAIQASMAGDAGKGFAVVADEVQRLAERSGAAAKQISALVKTIQSDTNEAVSSMEQTTAEVVQGTRLAQDAGVSLGEIESVSKSLAEIIENISDAARRQAASAGQITNTMKSIQEITTATTDGTKETATQVGNLAEMTNELRSSVSGFKLPESNG